MTTSNPNASTPNTSSPNTSTTLDTTGLICPEPIMLLHKAIRPLNSGDTVTVLATDPATSRDVPNFCRHLGHTLLEQDSTDGNYRYVVQKK